MDIDICKQSDLWNGEYSNNHWEDTSCDVICRDNQRYKSLVSIAIIICCNKEQIKDHSDSNDVHKLLWTVIITVTTRKSVECHQLDLQMNVMGESSSYGCEWNGSFTSFCYFSSFLCCLVLFSVHFMMSNDEEIKENVLYTGSKPECQAGLLQKGCFPWLMCLGTFVLLVHNIFNIFYSSDPPLRNFTWYDNYDSDYYFITV